ncbi:MAG: DUF5011 domain-containing protein [Clostridiales bacterium]|nr:DUF5011 domain-containing protein [Clostridiales bacterium]
MKGKKKLVLPLLLAGVTATTGYVAPVQQAVSAAQQEYSATTSVVGASVKVEEGFSDNYQVGDRVWLPEVTVGDAGEYEFKVTKGGDAIEIATVPLDTTDPELVDYKGKKYFWANYEGYYDITISTTNENQVKTVVDSLTVWVEKSDATIVLPVNSEYVIPAKMPVKQTGFKIPAPSVIIGDEEEATKIADLESDEQLAVLLYTPNSTEPIVLTEMDANKTYFAVSENNLEKAGTYTIVYEFRTGEDKDSDGLLDSVISRLDSNFQVVTSYDLSKVNLTMTLLDSVPTSGNVNTEIKVPKIKVTESSSSLDAINAYVKVKITNQTTKEVLPDEAFDYENYSFTPNKVGDYIITYKASIGLFNKTAAEITPDQSIKVADKQSATVRPTYDYTVDVQDPNKITSVNGVPVTESDDLDELLVNTKASIPSIAKLKTVTGEGKKVTITIPAIYGTDNLDTLSQLTFERSYRAPNGAVTTITNVEDNESAEITLSQVGTYEIRYKATDRAGNPAGYAEYDVVVYDVDEDMTEGKTKVDLNIPYTTISDRDQYLNFSVPTATDTYDSNIEVKTFYKVNGTGDPIEIKNKNEDGKYSIDVNKLIEANTGITSIVVYAEAYLDATLLDTRAAFATGTATLTADGSAIIVKSTEKTISIVNSKNDQDAPEIVVAGGWNAALLAANTDIAVEGATAINEYGFATDGSGVIKVEGVDQAAFNQGTQILDLPEVQFTDVKDDNLAITVTIKDAFGNVVSKVGTETITKEYSSLYTYTVKGVSFKLSNFGVYTVTYKAKDIGGNITVQTFGIRVNDKTAPTIVVEDEGRFDKDIEVGKKFEVPTAKLIKNGEDFEAQSITWDIYNVSKGAKYTIVGETGFVPLSEGTFSIVYSAVDIAGNKATLENSLFTVTAKDTVGPTIDLTNTFISALAWNPDENETYQTITIPAAFANDGKFDGVDYGYGKSVEVVYTVTGPNSTNPTVSKVTGDISVRTFKATSQGTYTIKYTATDAAGNTTTETRTLALGDCEKPVLEWANEKTDLPKTATLNQEFTLNLSKITLSDDTTEDEYLKEHLSVTLTDPSGNTVTNKGKNGVNAIWDITATGNYTLKFVVKDEVGNANTYSYQVNVPAEDVEEEKISPVVGTILVVVAVTVLAGVVVYFVVSSKKKGTSSTKKTTRRAKTSKK